MDYSAIVKDVQAAYDKVKIHNMDARHVICAYRMLGREFHELQDFHDDDEYGGDAHLLRILEYSEIMKRAIFVARCYDGTHIGKDCFAAIDNAVKSALVRAPYNSIR